MTPLAAPSPTSLLPKSVLFVCNQNTIRSPMAAACLKMLARGRLYTGSAGLIAGLPDGFTETVLSEKGLWFGPHEPQSLNRIDATQFSLIIALAAESHNQLMADGVDRLARIEFWDIAEPDRSDGKRERILAAYRAVRDDIKRQIEARFGYLNTG